MSTTDLPWDFIASASHFSYSCLETLYQDYQFACAKFGLAPHSHIRISKVASDEFRLCISMELSQLVDENLDAFTRSPDLIENSSSSIAAKKAELLHQ